MNYKRIVKNSFRVMNRNKLRTFFMMLGIIIGTLALFLSMSMGAGAKKKIMDNVERVFDASNIMVSAGGGGMMAGEEEGPVTTLTLEDIEALSVEVDNIALWDPFQMVTGKDVSSGDKTKITTILGGTPSGEEVWKRGVVEGEYFSDEDLDNASRVALIGTRIASELFEDSDPIGGQIKIGNVPYIVKGVLEPIGVDVHGMDRDLDVRVPITTLMRRVMNVDYLTSIKLKLKDASKMDATVDRISGILRERHALASGEPDDFSILTPVQIEKMVDGMNRTFSLFLPLIAAITTIVGALIITILMLMAVKDRRLEIGLRKAVGARSKDIYFQFLIEAVVVTLSGGIIGLLLGVAIAKGVAPMMGMPLSASPQALLIGISIPVIAGLIAGFVPAKRAASLLPVENLK